MLEVQPHVERRLGRNRDLQAETRKTLEDVVTLVLEVLLQSELLSPDVLRVEQGDCSKLQAIFPR